MRKVLITGGTGFLGKNLAIELIKMGNFDITITYHSTINSDMALFSGCKMIKADLTNFNECNKVCKDIDIIFHLASIKKNAKIHNSSPGLILLENNLINSNIIESARINKVKKLILTSSIIVYKKNERCDEESETISSEDSPHKGYAWSKRFAEILSLYYKQQYNLNIEILRIDNTFGPHDNFSINDGQVIPSLINKVANNKRIEIGNLKDRLSFVYVKDVISALIKFIDYSTETPINITSGESITFSELIEILSKELKQTVEIRELNPRNKNNRIIESKHIFYKTFNPKFSIKKGLKETIKHYNNNKV